MTLWSAGARVAGRFQLLRSLGAGGLAEVFEALDEATGEKVALKVLHEHFARDAQLVERLRRELSATRSLAHPGIVRVFDLHWDEGRPLLAMELLQGETLAARLGRGPLPAAQAHELLRQLCAALGAAHQAGIVHRDLKPQNIFLPLSGPAKILDFGMAHAAGWARLTATSTILGTAGYIAPELLLGQRADLRADLYALGATFFETLTGRAAFEGADPHQTLAAQQAGAPADASLEPSDAALLARALDPDPERRFSSAAQLARALDQSLPAPLAPPPGLVRGEFDVMVAESGEEQRLFLPKRLKKVCAELGVASSLGWRIRAGTGLVRLVSGASQASATRFAAWCRERGLITLVRKPRKLGWLAGFAEAHPVVSAAALGVAGGFAAALAMWVAVFAGAAPARSADSPGALGVAAGVVLAMIGWMQFVAGHKTPIKELPEGDPAVYRLLRGIERRAEAVALLHPGELAAAAARAVEGARGVAGRLAVAVDEFIDPEAATSPHGFLPGVRDRGLAQLLTVSAALDDALAAAATASSVATLQQADAQLRRLTDQLTPLQAEAAAPSAPSRPPASAAGAEPPAGADAAPSTPGSPAGPRSTRARG